MPDPWFDANLYGWIPGTLLGAAGGIVGTCSGIFAQRGKQKLLVMGCTYGAIAVCAILFVVGVCALLAGQPRGIWYGLGFPGFLGLIVFGPISVVLRRVYQQAESRRIFAEDLG